MKKTLATLAATGVLVGGMALPAEARYAPTCTKWANATHSILFGLVKWESRKCIEARTR